MLFIILKLMTIGQGWDVDLVASPSGDYSSCNKSTLLPSASLKHHLQCLSLTNRINPTCFPQSSKLMVYNLFKLVIPSYKAVCLQFTPFSLGWQCQQSVIRSLWTRLKYFDNYWMSLLVNFVQTSLVPRRQILLTLVPP